MLCSNSTTVDDIVLLRQAQNGDLEAYENLMKCFQKRVFGLAYRITGQRQDAEDVTQQTFLSLLQNLQRFREESTIAHWLLRITTNHSLKVLRKRRGLRVVPLNTNDTEEGEGDPTHLDAISLWCENPEDLAERAEIQQLIERATADLEESFREVFRLREVEGLSTRETAERLKISEANVKIRLLRARSALRKQLEASHLQ